MMRGLRLLTAYLGERRMRFASREALASHQRTHLTRFLRALATASPFYAGLGNRPLCEWPDMDKQRMLAHFDDINTAGLKLRQVFDAALDAERNRDFRPRLKSVNVGLSSGTSGQRGVFAISDREATIWAGVMLAKMLPAGLLARERVALFLRANSNVYETVRSHWIAFRYFDLLKSFDENLDELEAFDATIVVAPAQVLRILALRALEGGLRLRPRRVISVAEVLEDRDRELISSVFGPVHQVYQATEGFLASTCAHGVLHLNEGYVHVEPHWLDHDRRRFTPVITDFSRLTQPFVRYRLDDVLLARQEPCPCGSACLALDAIEGRHDDMLLLPGRQRPQVQVFADSLSRVLAHCLPREADYRLIQRGPASLVLHASLDPQGLTLLQQGLLDGLARLDVATEQLSWTCHGSVPSGEVLAKCRRIVREYRA